MKQIGFIAVIAVLGMAGLAMAGTEKEELAAKLTILNDRATGIQAMIERATPELQQRLKDVQTEAQPVIKRLNEIVAAEQKAEKK